MADITREQAAAFADAVCSTAIFNCTLRDLFAAFALAGLSREHLTPSEAAKVACARADAMMAQRAQTKE